MILYSNQEISVRRLEPADADLLVQWLSDPVLLEYYEGRDRPHTMAMVLEHYYGEAGNREITRGIVRYKSQDVGYIQLYPIDDEEKEEYGYLNYEGCVYGMDQFIGDPAFWNRGIGTLLVTGTVKYLTEVEKADLLVMDPQCWNHRALRVYEKSGFMRKKLLPGHEWHEGEYRDCWLLECRTGNQPKRRSLSRLDTPF